MARRQQTAMPRPATLRTAVMQVSAFDLAIAQGQPVSLDEITDAVETLRTAGGRLLVRIAVLLALARDTHFRDDFSGWLAWAEGVGGGEVRSRRQCLTMLAGGRFAAKWLVRFTALTDLPLATLEMLAALPDALVPDFLERYLGRLPDMARDELRLLVANTRHRGGLPTEEPEAAERSRPPQRKIRQPELPGLADFETLVGTVEPMEAAQYAASALSRVKRGVALLTDEQYAAVRRGLKEELEELEAARVTSRG